MKDYTKPKDDDRKHHVDRRSLIKIVDRTLGPVVGLVVTFAILYSLWWGVCRTHKWFMDFGEKRQAEYREKETRRKEKRSEFLMENGPDEVVTIIRVGPSHVYTFEDKVSKKYPCYEVVDVEKMAEKDRWERGLEVHWKVKLKKAQPNAD